MRNSVSYANYNYENRYYNNRYYLNLYALETRVQLYILETVKINLKWYYKVSKKNYNLALS